MVFSHFLIDLQFFDEVSFCSSSDYSVARLYEMVEFRKIEIRKNLAREISDWKPAAFLAGKKTLVARKRIPKRERASADAVFRRVGKNNFSHKSARFMLIKKPFMSTLRTKHSFLPFSDSERIKRSNLETAAKIPFSFLQAKLSRIKYFSKYELSRFIKR